MPIQAHAFAFEHAALTADWTRALSWMLIHSIWVAACAVLVQRALLAWVSPERCRLRYALCVASLLTVPLAALYTLSSELSTPDVFEWTSLDLDTGEPALLQAGFDALRNGLGLLRLRMSAWLAPLEGWVAAGWCVCASLALARLAGGWCLLWRDRSRGQRRATARVQARTARLGRRLGLRARVPLYWSEHCEVPMVVGARRPRIVLPSRLGAALERGDLDAVLLHELAHVRRHDAWARWMEAALSVLFVFNPALKPLLERVEREREHCCDRIALAHGADRVEYLRVLTALECSRPIRRPRRQVARSARLMWAQALRATDGALLERIQRMAGVESVRRRSGVACLGLVLGLGGLGLGLLSPRVPIALTVLLERELRELEESPASDHLVRVMAVGPAAGAHERVEKMIFLAKPDSAVVGTRAQTFELRIDGRATSVAPIAGGQPAQLQLAAPLGSAVQIRRVRFER
jgi:Zn-dependent protease with chaperone function